MRVVAVDLQENLDVGTAGMCDYAAAVTGGHAKRLAYPREGHLHTATSLARRYQVTGD